MRTPRARLGSTTWRKMLREAKRAKPMRRLCGQRSSCHRLTLEARTGVFGGATIALACRGFGLQRLLPQE
jgi:hypothetical protein